MFISELEKMESVLELTSFETKSVLGSTIKQYNQVIQLNNTGSQTSEYKLAIAMTNIFWRIGLVV